MLEVSLAAFMVSGAFQTEAYLDLFYHVVAGVVMLKVLAARNEPVVEAPTEPEAGAEPALPTGRRALPRTRPPRPTRVEGGR
jgi:hypothetical protein